MDVFAVASELGRTAGQLNAEEGATALFQVNLFWVIVGAISFVVFFVIIWTFAFKPVSRMLEDRRERIEQGLRAEQARKDRENAERSASPPSPRPARRRTTSWHEPRSSRRRTVTPTSRRRARARTAARACGGRDRRREAARHRRTAGRGRRPRAGRRESRRRRVHDRRAAAPAWSASSWRPIRPATRN